MIHIHNQLEAQVIQKAMIDRHCEIAAPPASGGISRSKAERKIPPDWGG